MKQVKIRRTFPRNRFYERVLSDWKQSVDDRNFRSVLSRALINLKAYPLDIATFADLKNIRGVGDHVGRKLEGAWNVFCSQNLAEPTVKQIDEMKRGEFMQFVNSANFLDQRSGPRIATATKAVSLNRSKSADSLVRELGVENVKPSSSGFQKRPPKVVQPSKKLTLGSRSTKNVPSAIVEQRCSEIPASSRPAAVDVKDMVNRIFDDVESVGSDTPVETGPACSVSQEHDSSIIYHPSTFDRSQVILIVDNRETANIRKFQQMCNLFQKKGIIFEMRSLSVGDYLWILRTCDGVEMVLDYIVERKTLDDLWSSIKQKRYEEQKQRLMSVGIPNVVYILEGSMVPEPALEQALITTHVENRFLVYCTNNMEHTSLVLSKITERLLKKANTQELTGMSFENFQKMARKTQRRCVRDVFSRQLTVCPQMSVQKASLVVDRFPSFAALTDFYASLPREQRATALSDNVPGITKAASANLAKFYSEI